MNQIQHQLESPRADGVITGEAAAIGAAERVPAASRFPLESRLASGINARLIVPGVDESVVKAALDICLAAFPHEPYAPDQMHRTYSRILSGEPFFEMKNPKYSDFGKHIEYVGYWAYFREEMPVAISGIYRYLEEPDRYWLGRIGVAPGTQGGGLGREIVDFTTSCIRSLGGDRIFAYTEDDSRNAGVHRWYDRMGFVLTSETFIEEGILQRVYSRGIPK